MIEQIKQLKRVLTEEGDFKPKNPNDFFPVRAHFLVDICEYVDKKEQQNAALIAMLQRCLPYIEPEIEQSGYGFFPGGDPTKFIPDEDNSPQEIENWKEACKRWNESKEGAEGSHRWLTDGAGEVIGTATIAHLGMGMYTYEDEEAKEIVKFIKGETP